MIGPDSDAILRQKFAGSLIGAMVGDTLGAPVVGWEADELARMLDGVSLLPPDERAMNYANYGVILGGRVPPDWIGNYTDDTQMTIGVAESLAVVGRIDSDDMAARFAANFDQNRGYAEGAETVLRRLRNGEAPETAADGLFGGQGSFGNGAAMRIAPVGLVYHRESDEAERRQAAEAQAWITHRHPLGTEGAVLQAAAVAAAARASTEDDFDPFRFVDNLKQELHDDSGEYLSSCDAMFSMLWDRPDTVEVADILGNGVEAYLSVPSAIYSFLAHHDSFAEAVLFAIRLGGDTDTIGAMCGAIAGAFHGIDGIPYTWLNALENGPRGRDYVLDLSARLYDATQTG